MKKILLILLILATSVMASEKLYINELFQLGGTLFTPDSVKVRVYSDLAIVADTSVTYTPSGGLLRDSIVGDFASAYELHFGVIVYKASFWGQLRWLTLFQLDKANRLLM